MQVFVCAIGNLDAVRRDASVLVVQFCSLGDIAAEAEHKFPARLHFGAGADPFILHTITHPAVRFFFVFSSRFAFLSFPSCGCVDGVVGRAGGSTAFPTRFFSRPLCLVPAHLCRYRASFSRCWGTHTACSYCLRRRCRKGCADEIRRAKQSNRKIVIAPSLYLWNFPKTEARLDRYELLRKFLSNIQYEKSFQKLTLQTGQKFSRFFISG